MTEEEALIRAREAAAQFYASLRNHDYAGWVRQGVEDGTTSVQIAKQALLDLDKPLPVDRDLADLRELWAASIEHRIVNRSEPPTRDNMMAGLWDEQLRQCIPAFRAIIQRRIEEARA